MVWHPLGTYIHYLSYTQDFYYNPTNYSVIVLNGLTNILVVLNMLTTKHSVSRAHQKPSNFVCSPPNIVFWVHQKSSGFACSPPNTQFFGLTKISVVLCVHHQILGFQAHQKSSSFSVITTNTCVQFKDGQNLFKVYKLGIRKLLQSR